jgi:Kef-type K+ transport system membrane component KefB
MIADLLLVILIVVIVARLIGELMERAGQLAILGELLAGVVLGVNVQCNRQYRHVVHHALSRHGDGCR